MSPDAGTTTGTESSPAAGADPGQLAMEEERDFLIRSLHDLESERAAGDIDQADYETLRDDYTVRAAALLRRLEDPELSEGSEEGDALPNGPAADDGVVDSPSSDDDDDDVAGGRAAAGRRGRAWRRREKVAVAAIVVSLAALVGWQIGHAANHRSAGETITGANVSGNSLSTAQVDELLIQAESEAASNPVGALQVYAKILAVYPDQPQALTEQGWLYAQAGALPQAATQLRHAETASASYDPAHGYLGIVLFGEKDYTGAVSELTYYLAHGPNPALTAQATQALKAAKIDEAAVATPSSTTVSP